MIIVTKAPFSECSLSTLKHKASVIKFFWFKERYENSFFVTVWSLLTIEIKLRFQISSAQRSCLSVLRCQVCRIAVEPYSPVVY